MWFRKTFDGRLWRPITWQGWTITTLWILVNVWYFARVDSQAHSASDTLLGVGPFFVVSTILYLVIIRTHCGRQWE